MNTPLIKWTGSKRPLATKIISYFPKSIETYHEPFLGGGSVFFELLRSNINVKNYQLSDKNESLINIFKIVKESPDDLIISYKEHWERLQKNPDYFYIQRDYYNKTKDPLSFYFLTRTCYNGTIRYNKNGDFNTSHHFGRPGMEPRKISEIVKYYSNLMKNKDINFMVESFVNISPNNKFDVLYLDPPYTNTKALYFGNISVNELKTWLNTIKCSWFMNINGINSTDNEENIDIDYTSKELLLSGNSSFSRIKGKNINVKEYFYYKMVNRESII